MVYLIINADDFGMSNVYNDCILDLLANGKITSTTVMVNRISDSQKVSLQHLRNIRETQDVSVGLHVEFSYDQHLKQLSDQYQKFIDLFESEPSHLDVHKEHLHTKYHGIVAEFCKSKKLPFRNHGKKFPEVATTSEKYFYGSMKDFDPIDEWLSGLEDRQLFELVFHPGNYDPNCFSSLNAQREWDLGHIDSINENLKKYSIELINFNHLKNHKITQM